MPVWLALPAWADWRWLRDRDDSPWYPTMRLFRQDKPGDWDGVFARIADALRQRLAGRAAPEAAPLTAYQQAMRHVARQEFGEALACFHRAVADEPLSYDAWHNLGITQVRKGQTDDALASLGKAVELRPDSAEARNNLGLVLLQKGNADAAVGCFRKGIELKPASAEIHNNLGTALMQLKRVDEAVTAYQRAIELRPELADTHRNLGFAHRLRRRFAEARACYAEALRWKPESAELHNDLGAAFLAEGMLEEALPPLREATRRSPACIDAWNNQGIALADLDRLDEAVAALEAALVHVPGHPETHRNLAMIRLMQGDLERGFREFEWRWQCAKSGQRSLDRPLWDGGDLEGRAVLLHAEQGLGDTLQFIRYAPLVKARGGTVVVECQKPLAALLARCAGIDHLAARGDPLPRFDLHAPLLSLPALAGTVSAATIPAPSPYVFADPLQAEAWGRELADWPGAKIGIAWQGNPKYGGDAQRSVPLRCFAPLAEIDGVRLVSLQKGHGVEQIAKLPRRLPLLDLDRQVDNPAGGFLETAAVMLGLDLVVTSDTAVAHLAGALGVPVWLALCTSCDWRWLRAGDTTPWYPTMRLFRQQRRGDWDDVFARIGDALRAWMEARGAPPLLAPVSPGELLDKLTILRIKRERIADPAKLRNVAAEADALERVARRRLPDGDALRALTDELQRVNEALWQVEDDLRDHERRGDFGPAFVALARSVYHRNDRRAALKRRVNDLLGSRLVEEKSYAGYAPAATEGTP